MRSRRRPAAGGITYFTVPERLVLQSTGELVGAPVRRCRTPLERARGMLGTSETGHEVLILPRARQVHTFGMRYPLDVIFCDRDWQVLHVVRGMKPARVTKWVPRARYVVELSSSARRVHVAPGDALRLETY